MTDQEITQDLTLSSTYRYIVRQTGDRPADPMNGSPLARGEREYGVECVDSWTGDVMSVHWALSKDIASLVAETQCGERNAAATAITFPSKLALFVDRPGDRGGGGTGDGGDTLEEVERILEWHLGRPRGVPRNPLDKTRLHVQAPEFNA